jgi:hypothetical protein
MNILKYLLRRIESEFHLFYKIYCIKNIKLRKNVKCIYFFESYLFVMNMIVINKILYIFKLIIFINNKRRDIDIFVVYNNYINYDLVSDY